MVAEEAFSISDPAIRVLGVLGGLDPRLGGPPVSAPNIWIASRRAGLNVSSAVCMDNPPVKEEAAALERLKSAGCETHCFPFARLFSRASHRWAISLPLALWLLRSCRRYDVIQTHGGLMFSTMVGGFAAKLSGRRWVIVPHSSLMESDVVMGSGFIKRILKRAARAAFLKYADAIVFSSTLEEQDTIRHPARMRAKVMYHPVVDERFASGIARTWPAQADNLRVGYLGRIHSQKNLEVLIEAVARVPRVRLLIAGEGSDPYRSRLTDLAARLRVSDRIKWLGFVTTQQKPAFFASIDVLALPSHYECFGMAPAEAMCCGVPVIVSGSTGIAEVVRKHECGLVVPPTVDGVVSAIELLRSAPERLTELSSRAIRTTEQELSFHAYGGKLAIFYAELAGVSHTQAGRLSG